MKQIFSFIVFVHLAAVACSQQLSQVTFSGGSNLAYLSLLTDREVLIRITEDGTIKEWGVEIESMRMNNYYAPQLQPYAGRVEYYGNEADSVSRGKVRSIGSSFIYYYGAFESPERIGKIRSVGNLQFDYFNHYENKVLRGKIKMIGTLWLDYYSTFDNEALQGKLKSVGSTVITYYSTFDDRAIRGKVKSIGSVNYTWYTSLDRAGYGGALKTGPFRQNTGGVVYIVQ